MGNIGEKMNSKNSLNSIDEFNSINFVIENEENGLCFKNHYLPDEILIQILSYIEPKQMLSLGLVCKKWCQLVKSHYLWMVIYERRHGKKAKKLPWFVYYCLFTSKSFDNLLRNGNGQEGFKHWIIAKNYGDHFLVEENPAGAEPLPSDVPDFNGHTSCFVTSFYECNKYQVVSLNRCNLISVILDYYKPHIYVSEWVAGRFDCGCIYTLKVTLNKEKETPDKRRTSLSNLPPPLKEYVVKHRVEQWEGKEWKKMEIVINDCPEGVRELIFEHEGQDTQFWKGHYGSKMAGGVVKLLFDSITPKDNDIFIDMFD